MNKNNENKMSKIAVLLKLSLGSLIILPYSIQALTTIDDSNINTYTSTGISTTVIKDDVSIVTTAAAASPQINIGSGTAILASSSRTVTIHSGNEFVIQTAATGNYNSSYGIRAVAGTLIANSDLTINMKDGRGIYLANDGSGTFNGAVTINNDSTSANGFIGIMAYSTSPTSGGTGTFNKAVAINSTANDSFGIALQYANNPDAAAPNLTFNDKVNINMKGQDSLGVSTEQGVETTIASNITFNNGLDIVMDNGVAINSNATNTTIIVNGTSNLESKNSAEQNAIQVIAGTVNINDKSTIKGDILVANQTDLNTQNSTLNLNLTNGSSITGSMDNYSTQEADGYSAGIINLSMAGSNSQWQVTNNSFIDQLNLSENAKITLGDQTQSVTANNAITLTTNSLSGSGVFEMRTAIGESIVNDLLKVTGTSQASGNHTLVINDSGMGSQKVTGSEVITLVETEGGDANFALNSSYVDVGQYRFTLSSTDARGTGTADWILTGTKNLPVPTPTPTPTPQKPQLTPTAQNSANILNSSYLINYIENQTLLQRMGQLRQGECDESGDVWGRIYGGKLNSTDKRLSNIDIDYYGLQLGVDRKVDIENANIYYGFFAGMSRGNLDYTVGTGHINSYNVGAYASYQDGTGFYVDGLVKYVHMNNHFNAKTGSGYFVKGNGDTKGFSIGAEIGKRFYLDPEAALNNEGVYLEPQGQLTFSHQSDATIKSSNGLKTKLDNYNSILGRISIVAGYTVVSNNNPVDFYIKTGYVREFDGKTAYTFNDTSKEKYNLGRNRWDNGIGATMQINKVHNFYADVVYSTGNKYKQKQLNVGYRYNF